MWAVRSRSGWANEPCRGCCRGCRPASRWTLTSSRRSNAPSGAGIRRPTPTSWRSLEGRCFTAARSTPGTACSSRPWRCARPTPSPSSCRPPTRALRCGRWGPGSLTGHVGTLDAPSSSVGRLDVRRGRRSGSPGLQRLPSYKAITAERRSGCPRHRRCCGHEPWRDLYTGCGYVTGWPCPPTHPAIWKLLGPRLRRSCGSAVVAAAAGTSPSASGCWACSHTIRGATATREHIFRPAALSTDPRLPHTLGRSLLGLAELAREDGDLDEAWELAHDSLGVLEDYGDRVGAAAALEAIADLAVALDEPERALMPAAGAASANARRSAGHH